MTDEAKEEQQADVADSPHQRPLDFALELIKRGWFVFPCWWPLADGTCACGDASCRDVGKHPLGRLVPHGFKDASNDPAAITAWWAQYPEANVGVDTGRSDLAVLDEDLRRGGASSLAELVQKHGLPETYRVRTGSGGHHYYFKRSGQALKGRGDLAPGLDLKADGGFVIAAGSHHRDGRYVCEDPREPADVPAWLIDLAKEPKASQAGSSQGADWVSEALQGVPEGQRNTTGTRLAGYFLGKHLAPAVVEQLLHDFGERCWPPLPKAETDRIVASIAGREGQVDDPEAPHDLGEPVEAFVARANTLPLKGWVIDGLINGGALTLFHGQPRSGKTLAILELLIALTTGTTAFGQFAVPRVRSALYVTEEDPERLTAGRVKLLLRGRGLATFPAGLHFSVRKGVDLDNPTWQAQLIEETGRRQYDIVVFEPLRSLTSYADQGPAELRPFAMFCTKLMRETTCDIWLGHHDTKPLARPDGRPRPQRASGGGIFSIADCPIHLERISGEPFKSLVTPSHYKFTLDPQPFSFCLDVEGGPLPTFRLRAGFPQSPGTGLDLAQIVLEYVRAHPDTPGNKVVQGIRRNKKQTLAALNLLYQGGQIDFVRQGAGKRWRVR